MKLRLRKIDDKLVFVLPDEVAARLDWGSGDIIDVSIDENGLKAVRTQTKHDRTMEIAREVMEEYRSVFETLAKT